MYQKIITLLLLSFLFFSCKEEPKDLMLVQKMEQKNKIAFNDINKAWNIVVPTNSPDVQTTLAGWKKWQTFVNELKQKPKTSISAFKLKVIRLVNQADSLYLQLPPRFNQAQVRSRLVALHTKLQSLDTYFSLDVVPAEKITPIIADINKELNAFYMQCEEIVVKSKIPTEVGEKAMISALDTTRNARNINFDEEEEKEKLILEKEKVK